MKQSIQDEYTHLKVSRQRKYQMRRVRDGLCASCGLKPKVAASYCLKCLVMKREHQRRYKGNKRRYNSLSRRLERAM